MKQVLIFTVLYLTLSIGGYAQSNADYSEANKDDRRVLAIPNAFTPNNDGTNDEFKILNFTDEKLVEFKVFNRWGTVVYHSNDPKRGWDGTFKGKTQPTGVYGYVIRIAYNDGFVETYKGTVTLLR